MPKQAKMFTTQFQMLVAIRKTRAQDYQTFLLKKKITENFAPVLNRSN